MEGQHVVILITAKDNDEAKKISRSLLEQKLAACANIVSDVQSLFWWGGKVDRAQEALMIVKSQKALVPQLIDAVKRLHSYSVPEIIGLPIVAGNADYLDWIDDSVKKTH